MDEVQRVNDTLEQARSTLSPSQVKKLRKKRGKLFQQVVHQQLNADESAAKRLCLDEPGSPAADPETSLQLSSHAPGAVAAAAAAAAQDQEAASQLQSQPLPLRTASNGAMSHQQEQQQQQWQHGSAGNRHAGHDKHVPQPAAPTSSTSTGPCRTDMSGQLVVIQQQLCSNNSQEGNSNSTFSQLLLRAPAQAASDSNPLPATHATTLEADWEMQHAPPAPASEAGSEQQQPHRQQQPQQQQPQSRKRSRPSCQYGNYHHYYGYRLKPSGFEDPRLKVLDPAWFKGADVLDVGCNEGLVTLALAVHCGCHSVCGVDIDPVLVAKACTNLSRSRSQLNQQLHTAIRERNLPGRQPWQQQPQQQQRESGPLDIIAASTMQPPAARHANNSSSEGSSHPDDCQAATAGQQPAPPNGDSSGPSSGSVVGLPPRASKQRAVSQEQQQHQQPRLQKPPHAHLPQQQRLLPQQQQLQGNEQQQQQPHLGPKARIVATQRQIKALSRVSFKSGNWLVVPCPSNKYEVITCFSVTKWIQLNWGDDGIMSLFHKFYRCLAPGGLLVLEPQPFKSYKNAVHKPGVEAAPFVDLEQLKLRPEQYADYLTQRVGFELVQQLSAVSEAAGADAVSVKGFDRPILVLRKPMAGGGGGGGGGGSAGN